MSMAEKMLKPIDGHCRDRAAKIFKEKERVAYELKAQAEKKKRLGRTVVADTDTATDTAVSDTAPGIPANTQVVEAAGVAMLTAIAPRCTDGFVHAILPHACLNR